MSYLHSQNPPVIFRDLKPANIMVTPDGTVKLIDFGIARHFKPGQTRDTQRFGTSGYAPPEQYGKGQTDARSDIYSLGVTLHELLTGHDPTVSPFNLPPPRQLNPALSPHVEAVIQRATQTRPEDRFQTVAEMRQELIGHEESPPPPRLSALRPAAQPPRHAFGCPTWVAVILLLLAAAIPTLIYTPIGGWVAANLHGIVSETPGWITANWSWIVLILVVVATIAGHRLIVRALGIIGNVLSPQPLQSPTSMVAPPSAASPVPPQLDTSTSRSSVALKPSHRGWMSHANKSVIEDLILQEDFERLKSFIVDAEGGRFVLTGYGRFGGTSLVKGSMERVRRELRRRTGLNQGALLSLYFHVNEDSEQQWKFEIEANEVSFGTLTTQFDDVDSQTLETLQTHAEQDSASTVVSSVPFAYRFALAQPIDRSFFSRSGFTGWLAKKQGYDSTFAAT